MLVIVIVCNQVNLIRCRSNWVSSTVWKKANETSSASCWVLPLRSPEGSVLCGEEVCFLLWGEMPLYKDKIFLHLLSSDIIHTPLTSQEEEIGQKERQGNIINFLSVCLTFVSLNLFIYLFSSFNAECSLTLHYPEGLQAPNTRREKRGAENWDGWELEERRLCVCFMSRETIFVKCSWCGLWLWCSAQRWV